MYSSVSCDTASCGCGRSSLLHAWSEDTVASEITFSSDKPAARPSCVVDGVSADLPLGAIQDVCHRPLANYAPLPIMLGCMPIRCLAADVGLVDLDGSERQAALPFGQGGTDTMT